jgi:hypothetical protein
VSLIRVLKSAAATVARTMYVDEVATDFAAPPTYTVKRLDGTSLFSGTATDVAGTGNYSIALPGGPTFPASATWQLDTLVVAWTGSIGGAVITVTDTVEVVGGFFFGLAEVRAEFALSAVTYPTATLAARRLEVEQRCEEKICRRAFVPRFARETLSGTDTDRLAVRWPELRVLRAVTVAGVAWSAPDVAAVGLSAHGVLTRPGGAIWPAGSGNIIVEYEHGLDFPPEPVKSASMIHLRALLGRSKSGVPDRAASFTSGEGGTYRLTLPGEESTGIPDVDAAYMAYARKRRAVVA